MSGIEARLKELNIVLPDSLPPVVASYTALFSPYVSSGNLIHFSGRLAKKDGLIWRGKLGLELTVAEGKVAAEGVFLELLTALREATGDLDRVRRIVRLMVLVNGSVDFEEPHVVAGGASELCLKVFGERGAHARTTMCVSQLPFGACVEIDMIAEVHL